MMDDLEKAFGRPIRFKDNSEFETRLMKKLNRSLWMHQSVLGVGGFLIGLTALSQIFGIEVRSHGQSFLPRLDSVTVQGEAGLKVGTRFIDDMSRFLIGLFNQASDMSGLMHHPTYLMMGLSLSLGLVIYYLVGSQDETF